MRRSPQAPHRRSSYSDSGVGSGFKPLRLRMSRTMSAALLPGSNGSCARHCTPDLVHPRAALPELYLLSGRNPEPACTIPWNNRPLIWCGRSQKRPVVSALEAYQDARTEAGRRTASELVLILADWVGLGLEALAFADVQQDGVGLRAGGQRVLQQNAPRAGHSEQNSSMATNNITTISGGGIQQNSRSETCHVRHHRSGARNSIGPIMSEMEFEQYTSALAGKKKRQTFQR